MKDSIVKIANRQRFQIFVLKYLLTYCLIVILFIILTIKQAQYVQQLIIFFTLISFGFSVDFVSRINKMKKKWKNG